MRNVLTIFKKECARFFKDKRMIASVILPGLMIFIVYTVMGSVIAKIGKADEGYKYKAYIVNAPDEVSAALSPVIDKKQYDSENSAKAAVKEGELDLVILFPADFDLEGQTARDVQIFYNGTEDNSISGYGAVCALLEVFKMPKFTINAAGDGDLAGEKATAGKMLSSFMPIVLFSLLAAGCVAVTPESIAGEKERGTLATIFITPIKRWQLAAGKIASLSLFATLSGLSSFIGLFLSMPKLMGGMITGETAAYYSFGDYAAFLALIVSVLLVLVSAFAIISAFAKSVKEAASLIAPLMVVVILMGVFTMAVPSAAIGLYAIPLLGSAIAFSSIMNFSLSVAGTLLAIFSNLALAVTLAALLSFMFKSERIMFNR